MNIPTAVDWAHHPDDLDAATAYNNFYGKSLDDAFELFVENSMYYQEDVMFMPRPCFYFYVHAYIDYLMSEESKDDSDGASCFFGIVRIRRSEIRDGPPFLRERILQLSKRLADMQNWFDADAEIYGDFRSSAKECQALIGG